MSGSSVFDDGCEVVSVFRFDVVEPGLVEQRREEDAEREQESHRGSGADVVKGEDLDDLADRLDGPGVDAAADQVRTVAPAASIGLPASGTTSAPALA